MVSRSWAECRSYFIDEQVHNRKCNKFRTDLESGQNLLIQREYDVASRHPWFLTAIWQRWEMCLGMGREWAPLKVKVLPLWRSSKLSESLSKEWPLQIPPWWVQPLKAVVSQWDMVNEDCSDSAGLQTDTGLVVFFFSFMCTYMQVFLIVFLPFHSCFAASPRPTQ